MCPVLTLQTDWQAAVITQDGPDADRPLDPLPPPVQASLGVAMSVCVAVVCVCVCKPYRAGALNIMHRSSVALHSSARLILMI